MQNSCIVMIIIETQKDDIHAWMKAKIVFQERKGMDWITKDELSKKTKHELMQIIAKTQWQMKAQRSGASAYDDDDDDVIRRDFHREISSDFLFVKYICVESCVTLPGAAMHLVEKYNYRRHVHINQIIVDRD
eukprot:532094_1